MSGTVVNSVTGEPVPHALVVLAGQAGTDAILSGQDGKFEFHSIPTGEVVVAAQKPGFFDSGAEADDHPPEPVHVGENSRPVLIRLVPEAVISGHVEDIEHDPLSNAYIWVLAPDFGAGRRKYRTQAQTRTDEEGNFRLPGLPAGEYFVGVGPEFDIGSTEAGQEHDLGYAPVLYPDVNDIASATATKLTPGQQSELLFTLRPQPVFRVTGRLTGQFRRPARVSLSRRSLPGYFRFGGVDPATGIFMVRYIPAGNYVLRAPSQDGDTSVVAEAELTVAADVDRLELPMRPALSFPVTVHGLAPDHIEAKVDATPDAIGIVKTVPMGMDVYVGFEPEDWWMSASANQVQPWSIDQRTGSREIGNVLPGRYVIRISPQRGYVAAARCGTIDLLQEKLVIPPGSAGCTIEITLRDEAAHIEARLPGAVGHIEFLVLLPESAPMMPPELMPVDGETGKAEFDNLAPGDYSIFAFDSIAGLPYADRDFLRRYASKATRVTLGPKGRAQVEPQVITIQ